MDREITAAGVGHATRWLVRPLLAHPLLAGVLLELVVGAVPAAIVAAGDWSSCAGRRGDRECDDHFALPTPWFLTRQARVVGWLALVLVALAIPAASGLAARRWRWVPLCAAAAEASAVLGAGLGAYAANAWYPAFYHYGADAAWESTFVALVAGCFGLVLAVRPAAVAATIGVAIGRGRRGRAGGRATPVPAVRLGDPAAARGKVGRP
jgi:hypothetical protein